jgi:basic amino acid/polyamine antiporter, APA family
MSHQKLGFYTAISIVIANMVGTGVFTSLGFQVMGIQDGFSLLALWITGGILALCGALIYAEIGAALPENGGEFHYLSKLYHPAVGFLSGWVSVTVGFAAPVAAASMALGKYLQSSVEWISPVWAAIAVILVISFIHTLNLKTGGAFQRVFTFIKISVIAVFIIAGITCESGGTTTFLPGENSFNQLTSASFAASLIYVTYAYSGWNAAAYVSAELDNVNKTLPRALLIGTGLVLAMYTLLNYVFLKSTPVEQLQGQIEIGHISASSIFGAKAGYYMSFAIAILLISTISAMILAGPRVMQSMGQHYKSLSFFATTNKNGIPFIAILFQSFLSIVLVIFSSFESLINYVGFTLNLFTLLTVFGIFILRYKFKNIERPFKSPLFPIPAILFISIIFWILFNMMKEKPLESLLGLATVTAGLVFYFTTTKFKKQNENI